MGAGPLLVVLGVLQHSEQAQTQNRYLEGLKSAQFCGGMKGYCPTFGADYYLDIGVGGLYSASCAFIFSKFQTWSRPVRAWQQRRLCFDGPKLQQQPLYDFVRDQRLLATSSEAHGPATYQTGGTNLSWARGVRINFEDIITTVHTWRRFINHKQVDQASAKIRGTHTRSDLSAKADRSSVCPFLADRSPHTSELMFRSAGQFQTKRQGRRHEIGGWVAGGLH